MRDKKKIIKILGIIILVVVCFIYLYSKGTYTIYESKIDNYINPEIANWSIKVNDVVVTTSEVITVDISNISWEAEHVATNKVAPGSVGTFDINIDPMDTEVAIRYDIEIVDKTVDTSKILTVSSVVDDLDQLIRTGTNTYTGIITLDDINNKIIKNIKIGIEWIDDNTEIEFSDDEINDTDYLEINFTAFQYSGEEIVPFIGD